MKKGTKASSHKIEKSDIKDLVKHMMEIEEFLRSTMALNLEFEAFLEENPASNKKVKSISRNLNRLLSSTEDDSLMSDYIIAFNHMKSSHGYAMVQFLESEPELAEYLMQVMDEIDAIYYQYLLYEKHKLENALRQLSVDTLTTTPSKNITCTFHPPSRLRFKISGKQDKNIVCTATIGKSRECS